MINIPWFYTAFSLWKIAAEAERDNEAKTAIREWEKMFENYLSSPHPARRGNYIPVNPDTDGKHGFPGDQTENRDALFPIPRKPANSSRKRRRRKKTAGAESSPETPSPAPELPAETPAPSEQTAPA